MECPFQVGDQVVCINGERNSKRKHTETWPVTGRIYTVRELFECSGHIGIRLVEIVNPVYEYTQGVMEMGWQPFRFRPVKKTDISIFTAMLTKIPENV
jgi:hypothetical protein